MASKLRWLAAIALAAAAAVASGAGTAQARPRLPGWRITAVYPEDSQVGNIAAASADNAWTVEGCTRPCHTGHDGTTLRHWNGKQWQIVSALPAHVFEPDGLEVPRDRAGREVHAVDVLRLQDLLADRRRALDGQGLVGADPAGQPLVHPGDGRPQFVVGVGLRLPGDHRQALHGPLQRQDLVGRAIAGDLRDQRQRRLPDRHLGDRHQAGRGQERLADGRQPLERDQVDHQRAAQRPGAGQEQGRAAVDRGQQRPRRLGARLRPRAGRLDRAQRAAWSCTTGTARRGPR